MQRWSIEEIWVIAVDALNISVGTLVVLVMGNNSHGTRIQYHLFTIPSYAKPTVATDPITTTYQSGKCKYYIPIIKPLIKGIFATRLPEKTLW